MSNTKNTNKRVISLLKLAVLLVIGTLLTSAIAFAAFTDVPGHPYEDAINFVESNGVVEGYQDGTYQPDNNINRAEFTKIVMVAVHGPNHGGDHCFPDVTDQWFAPFVCTAHSMGIIQGYDDNTFRPENNVNYAEALKIVLSTYSSPVGPDYDEWYQKYVDFAAGNGLSFAPGKNPGDLITRGEMAELIYWLEGSPPGNPGATGCVTDGDCLPAEACHQGMCVLNPGSCNVDADCPTGEVCTQGACTAAMFYIYPGCGSDGDCYTGQSCNTGTCEFNNPGQSCVLNTDCAITTQFCLNSQCTESAIQCTDNSHCNQAAGETCNTGNFSCERPCGLDTDCPTGQVCDSGMCNFIYIPECNSDADCVVGEICDPTIKQCM